MSTAVLRNLLVKVLKIQGYDRPLYLGVHRWFVFRLWGVCDTLMRGDQMGVGSTIEFYGGKSNPKFKRYNFTNMIGWGLRKWEENDRTSKLVSRSRDLSSWPCSLTMNIKSGVTFELELIETWTLQNWYWRGHKLVSGSNDPWTWQ